jgi:hypothetical protein
MDHNTRYWYGYEEPNILGEDDGVYLYVNEPVIKRGSLGLSDGRFVPYEEIIAAAPRIAFRYHVYKLDNPSRTTSGSKWTYCDHRIDEQAIRAETHLSPQFAFRVVSDQSAGVSADGMFQSEAVKQGIGTDIQSMSEEDIASNLMGHMRGKVFASHWISFTVSPLFVFDRALRLAKRGDTNLRLAIIDLAELPANTQIYHAGALLEGFNVESRLHLKNVGAAELLVWDKLRAPFKLVSLAGFFSSAGGVLDSSVEQTYNQLQPAHFGPMSERTKADVHEFLRDCRRRLRAPRTVRVVAHKSEANKIHEMNLHKVQAPRAFKEKYTASRKFFGKRVNAKWDKNPRVPISVDKMVPYIALVQAFPVRHRFPMLVALLSARLYHFERDSIIELLKKMVASK